MADASWYPDPDEPGMLRYFDGTVWTEHTQPAPAAEPAAGTVLVDTDPDPEPVVEPEPESFVPPAEPAPEPVSETKRVVPEPGPAKPKKRGSDLPFPVTPAVPTSPPAPSAAQNPKPAAATPAPKAKLELPANFPKLAAVAGVLAVVGIAGWWFTRTPTDPVPETATAAVATPAAETTEADVVTEPAAEPAATPDPAANWPELTAAAGTATDPVPVGERADVGDGWFVKVDSAFDYTATVTEAGGPAAPDGFIYVGYPLTIWRSPDAPAAPVSDVSYVLIDNDAQQASDINAVCDPLAPPVVLDPTVTVQPGGQVTGVVCVPTRSDLAAAGPTLLVKNAAFRTVG